MGRVIVITSGKGGVGKTTTTANIGAGLALMGKKTLVIDTDIGLRNLDVVMGLENEIVYDILDVVEGRCSIQKAIIKDDRIDELYLMPAAQTRDKNDLAPEQMIKLCDELRLEFDYVLIDCPAGIEQGFKNATIAADTAIIVINPDKSSMRDADRIVAIIEHNNSNIKEIYLCVNRLRVDLAKDGSLPGLEDMIMTMAVKFIGAICEDEEVQKANYNGGFIVTNQTSIAGQAYRNIVKRILGETVPLIDMSPKKKWYKRFFNR